MHVYVNNKGRGVKPDTFPAFIMETDNWDDYSTKCQFYVIYYSKNKEKHDIGNIKVLHKEESRTVLENVFEELTAEYISLGQDLEFYENLLKFCKKRRAIKFLELMRDISWQPRLAEPFETLSSFRNALLRYNSAQKARRFGSVVINGESVVEDFGFTYKCQIHGAENETEVVFDFNAKDPVPGRIVGIIGRNATGKTRFLSQIAQDLVKIRRTSLETEKQREESFFPQRPIFNRLLTLSFSAFDRFARPQSEQVSYVYCGIRNEKGLLSRKGLEQRFRSNLVRIKDAGRSNDWVHYMREILGDAGKDIKQEILKEIVESESEDDALALLSSGQAILAHAITSLLAWIEPESMVLFDEPETHLHPNAVSSLFNVYNDILDDYDSYSIMATHSPVVIQEVPSKRVILFDRQGKTTVARSLGLETFGENISELTRHVFDTIEITSFYKERLRKLSRHRDFENVMGLFDNNLSMSAQSFLMSLYMEDGDEAAE
jgi:ABC-type cobalamin/Fe3+-siderophores transport system ATPase subunit